MTKRVLILATDGFEQSELEEPRRLLQEAGIDTLVASPKRGEIRGWKKGDWGDTVRVDMLLEDAREADFDGLMIPGGQINPDKLRTERRAVALVQAFDAADKPIAAICHAPWLLAEADVIEGKTVTGWPSIRTDLKNAGGTVTDQEVAIDGNLITSRKPEDIPAFSQALIAAVERTPVIA